MQNITENCSTIRRPGTTLMIILLVTALISDMLLQVQAEEKTHVMQRLHSIAQGGSPFEEIPTEALYASSREQDHHHHHRDDDDHDDGNHTDNRPFCQGMYMTMFTDGFRWSLKRSSSNNATNSPPPCLAYYVSSWKLSEGGKFRGAMVFSFLLALLTEGLSASRFFLIQYLHAFATTRNGGYRSRRHKVLLTIVYALQQWLGTMIMLVSMMYSIEMLLSVVAGLMAGNFLFVRDYPNKQQQRTMMMNPSAAMGQATGPIAPYRSQSQQVDPAIRDTGDVAVEDPLLAGVAAVPDAGGVSNRKLNPTTMTSGRFPSGTERQVLLRNSSSSLEMQTRKID